MMNGKEINGEIGSGKGAKDGVVADVVKRYDRGPGTNPIEIYNELFLMTVSRRPTKQETDKLEEVRMGRAFVVLGTPPAPKGSGTGTGVPPKGPPPKGPPKGPTGPGVFAPGALQNDVAFYQDVFWALLNCNEFMLNH